MASTEDRITLRLVHVGRWKSRSGKVVQLFRVVDDQGKLGEEMGFSGRGVPTRAGSIYTVEGPAANQGTVYTNTFSYEGPWPDQAERLAMYAEARAFDAKERAKSAARRQETRNLIADTLEPLRRVYQNTSFQQKIALEVLVLNYLRTGKVD